MRCLSCLVGSDTARRGAGQAMAIVGDGEHGRCTGAAPRTTTPPQSTRTPATPGGASLRLLNARTRPVVTLVYRVVFGTIESAMRRFITPGEVPAWVSDGRWGPRRARVTECVAIATAERIYDVLMQRAPWRMRPGAFGEVAWTVEHRTMMLSWELRVNRLWRFGRAFLRCSACGGRATRIYLARVDAFPACRTCLGLSYESRQDNYRDAGRLKRLGVTSRMLAALETSRKRRRARAAALERYAHRRVLLAK